ncbi:hypothetical protein EC973_000069 [Apophysomyces ossiformis]|uniref:NADP-dependent oxidoreductase domain-containing protein n=1 Tax=Apophysomyces ossiformis TaxID=679940 RepID=A0A8H7BX04_9FUNG|nr:hypothetical protein EC973_000069 [Apophysomyces ossiformis]
MNPVNDSLQRLGLEYLDLYLIHWPGTSKKKLSDPKNRENRTESYRALEQLHREGKLRHIGVSNYTAAHLQYLLENCDIVPHVHQFELHPCLYQPDILSICTQHQIQVQAYSSLGEGRLVDGSIRLEELERIANGLHVTSAQVLLRWAVQHGWAVIPKSKSSTRVQQNADIFSFDLSAEKANFEFEMKLFETYIKMMLQLTVIFPKRSKYDSNFE